MIRTIRPSRRGTRDFIVLATAQIPWSMGLHDPARKSALGWVLSSEPTRRAWHRSRYPRARASAIGLPPAPSAQTRRPGIRPRSRARPVEAAGSAECCERRTSAAGYRAASRPSVKPMSMAASALRARPPPTNATTCHHIAVLPGSPSPTDRHLPIELIRYASLSPDLRLRSRQRAILGARIAAPSASTTRSVCPDRVDVAADEHGRRRCPTSGFQVKHSLRQGRVSGAWQVVRYAARLAQTAR